MSEATKQFYSTLYRQHGASCRALSFSSAGSQQVRFGALAKVLPEDRDACFSVLDVGCGFGDLRRYLREAGYSRVDYSGVDIMPEFVEHAAAAHPDGNFASGDFLSMALPRSGFDYVLSSGALNLRSERYPDHYVFIFGMIDRMIDVASRGVAFNLLSQDGRHHFPNDPRFFYSDPQHVLAHCRRSDLQCELDHDYLSYDFAIRMRPAGHRR